MDLVLEPGTRHTNSLEIIDSMEACSITTWVSVYSGEGSALAVGQRQYFLDVPLFSKLILAAVYSWIRIIQYGRR